MKSLLTNRSIGKTILVAICLMFLVCTNNTLAEDIMLSHDGLILSPDGKTIAFCYIYRTTGKIGANIGIIQAKIPLVRTLTTHDINESPSWSKDKKELLYRISKKDGIGLRTVNIETLEQRTMIFQQYETLTQHSIKYSWPLMLPFADKAIFVEYNTGNDLGDKIEEIEGDIYIAEAGGNTNLLQKGVLANNRGAFDISHDGKYLFFLKRKNGYQDIWKRQIDGSRESCLTEKKQVVYLKASPVRNEIVFVARQGKKYKAFILKIDSVKSYKIFEGTTQYLGFPSWSYDGRVVVFANSGFIYLFDTLKGKLTKRINVRKKTNTTSSNNEIWTNSFY